MCELTLYFPNYKRVYWFTLKYTAVISFIDKFFQMQFLQKATDAPFSTKQYIQDVSKI